MIPCCKQVENVMKYRTGQRLFIVFKDKLVDLNLLKLIQRNVN
jgi:hypothetical protein